MAKSRNGQNRCIKKLLGHVIEATLVFIFWRGLAITSAMEGECGFIYNLVKS